MQHKSQRYQEENKGGEGKIKDLQVTGIPCAFCYVAPWSDGLVFNGDKRMTNIITTMAEKLVAAIGEEDDQSSGKEIILRHLPGPLLDLNLRTLQSVVIARPPCGMERY